MDQSIQERLEATLSKLGVPAPANMIQTMLMRDGYFVGWKFSYDGGCAVLQASGKIDFYNAEGALLKAIPEDTTKKDAA